MEMIVSQLIAQGIPTFKTNIYTPLAAETQIDIGKTLPENIGRIYGLSIAAGGVHPEVPATTLISVADAATIWLQLQVGSTVFLDPLRLDYLIFSAAASTSTPSTNPQRWLPVNIPANFSLQDSVYFNPGGVTGKTICLELWYINSKSWKQLLQQGVVKDSA